MTGFTEKGAKRVADATLYIERASRNSPSGKGQGPTLSPLGRYAKIKAGEDGKYSWVAVKHNSDGEIEEDEEWGTGSHEAPSEDEEATGYAIESRWKSTSVIFGDIVWITPAMGQDFYVFDYNPSVRLAKITDADEITAREDETPGEGEVKVLVYDTDDDLFSVALDDDDEEITVTVKNPFRTVIEIPDGDAETELYLQMEFRDGQWWVTGVECDTGGA